MSNAYVSLSHGWQLRIHSPIQIHTHTICSLSYIHTCISMRPYYKRNTNIISKKKKKIGKSRKLTLLFQIVCWFWSFSDFNIRPMYSSLSHFCPTQPYIPFISHNLMHFIHFWIWIFFLLHFFCLDVFLLLFFGHFLAPIEQWFRLNARFCNSIKLVSNYKTAWTSFRNFLFHFSMEEKFM